MLGRPTKIVLALFLLVPLSEVIARSPDYQRAAPADQAFFQALADLAPFLWAVLLIGVMAWGYYRERNSGGKPERQPGAASIIITALGCVLTLMFVAVLGVQTLLA